MQLVVGHQPCAVESVILNRYSQVRGRAGRAGQDKQGRAGHKDQGRGSRAGQAAGQGITSRADGQRKDRAGQGRAGQGRVMSCTIVLTVSIQQQIWHNSMP